MHIGIDARMYGKAQSGIGNYIEQITTRIFLLDQQNDYYLFLLEPIFSQYTPPSAKVHKIKVDSPWYSYAEQTKFLLKLNKYKLDLMHFPHFNAPIFYNKKRVHTIHDITPNFFPGHKQKSWWRKKAYQLTLQTALKKSAAIIVDSQYTKNDLQRYFKVPGDKLKLTYLSVEENFKIIENYAKIKELKDKYRITKPFLFFISAWRSHKNFEGLISAFNTLKSQYHLDCQLVLGGQEDPHYPNISQAIKASPFKADIIVPGFISDQELPIFYNAADIFVLPSFYEGFGLIGLEAMACATPVVSSNLGSLPEVMADAALYFDPHNSQEMAEKIYQVFTSEEIKNQLKLKGLQQVKKYSWNNCAGQTLQIYNDLLHHN